MREKNTHPELQLWSFKRWWYLLTTKGITSISHHQSTPLIPFLSQYFSENLQYRLWWGRGTQTLPVCRIVAASWVPLPITDIKLLLPSIPCCICTNSSGCFCLHSGLLQNERSFYCTAREVQKVTSQERERKWENIGHRPGQISCFPSREPPLLMHIKLKTWQFLCPSHPQRWSEQISRRARCWIVCPTCPIPSCKGRAPSWTESFNIPSKVFIPHQL